MKRGIWIAPLAAVLLVAAPWAAAPSQSEADQLLLSLRPQGYVNDYAGILSPAGGRRLEQLAGELERKTAVQMAIVVLPGLEGGEIRDFANRLFEQWGIGNRDADNGILILTALQERRIWIEVGYGLEPVLPDGRVGRVLDDSVIPWFRQGRYEDGLIAGASSLARLIAEDAGVHLADTPESRAPPRKPRQDSLLKKVAGAIFLIVMIVIFIRNPWLFLLIMSQRGGFRGGFGGGFGRGGGFGGFGGGMSGGGGAGRSW